MYALLTDTQEVKYIMVHALPLDTGWVKYHGECPSRGYTMSKVSWWMPFLWLQGGQSIMLDALLVGTGMIASSSTFRPHPGRVIRDLFRPLDAVYGIVRKH